MHRNPTTHETNHKHLHPSMRRLLGYFDLLNIMRMAGSFKVCNSFALSQVTVKESSNTPSFPVEEDPYSAIIREQ